MLRGPGPWCSSWSFDVSPNGEIVVGGAGAPSGVPGGAFRWTQATGLVQLGSLQPNGSSEAYAISGDTTTIVGSATANTSSGFAAFRWTQELGTYALGDLTGGGIGAAAVDVSLNGSVVVGTAGTLNGPEEAFRWVLTDSQTGAGVMTGLGDLPGGTFDSIGAAVSADGEVVVGWGSTPAGYEPFIWTRERGMRNLRTVLVDEYHLDLNGWDLRDGCHCFGMDISADGTRIVGSGRHNGADEGWIVVLPRCYANCDASSVAPTLNIADFTCFLNRFAAGDQYANCDLSTVAPVLNIADFTCFLNAFASGCS